MEYSPIIHVCILKFLEKFRPFDRYATNFTQHRFNFTETEEQKLNFINTYDNYSVIFLFIAFLITDALGYRLLVILGSFVALIKYSLLFFQPSLFLLYQVGPILEALFEACGIGSSTYLYSKIRDTSKYQMMTAYVDASVFYGVFMAYLYGMIYVDVLHFIVDHLLVYNIMVVYVMLIYSFLLPPVNLEHTSNYVGKAFEDLHGRLLSASFTTKNRKDEQDLTKSKNDGFAETLTVIKIIWYKFKTAYTNINVLKWSIWWSLTLFLSYRIQYHCVSFFIFVENDDEYFFIKTICPVVDMIHLIISAILVIICARRPTKWQTKGDRYISLVSFFLSVSTLALYFHIPVQILTVIRAIFVTVVEVFLIISVWEIVQIIPENSYALVLGFNTFVAKVLHSLLPFSARMIDFVAKQEFVLYGMCFAIMGLVFGLFSLARMIRPKNKLDILVET